jgi:excisionase family DNA binding protein
MADVDPPVLLTVDETAALLRTSRKAIYAMVERAQLAGVVRIGRRVLIRRVDLMRWLEGLNRNHRP